MPSTLDIDSVAARIKQWSQRFDQRLAELALPVASVKDSAGLRSLPGLRGLVVVLWPSGGVG